MIKVVTPDSFIKGSHFLKEAFIRFSPKRGEVILSKLLLEMIGHKKGQTVQFIIDSNVNEILVSIGQKENGFRVSLDKGRGRVYSVPLIKLMERVLGCIIMDPVSVPIDGIPRIINELYSFKLCTDGLKQSETTSEGENVMTVYKQKAYTKKVLLSKIRAYWARSFSSVKEETRTVNLLKYKELKRFCQGRELDIDFIQIETTPN